jgi:hypothetical protein
MVHTIIAKKGTNALYAASKTSATYKTALSPETLRNGSIGIYGLNEVDSVTAGNSDKWTLITDAAGGAGWTDKSAFKGKFIKICVGDDSRTSGFVESSIIDITKINQVVSTISAATQKQVTYIGYNSATTVGSFNFNGKPVANDIVGIRSFMKLEGAFDYDPYEYQVVCNADEDYFSSLSRLVKALNADTSYAALHNVFAIVANVAATNSTATLAVTKGSATATMSGADAAIAVGAFIVEGGNWYKIISKVSTTITLDRPWTDATAAAKSATGMLGAEIQYPSSNYTQYGIRITSLVDTESFQFSVEGFAENANIDHYIGAKDGQGTVAEVKKMEMQGLPFRGGLNTAQIDFRLAPTNQIPASLVDSSAVGYDVYTIIFTPSIGEQSMTPMTQQTQYCHVAFEIPTALGTGNGDTATHNQSDFEDIMVVLFPATPLISA